MLTSRVSFENEIICAWVDKEDTPWIEQPFNPNGHQPWASELAAKTWADSWIEEFNNTPEATPL